MTDSVKSAAEAELLSLQDPNLTFVYSSEVQAYTEGAEFGASWQREQDESEEAKVAAQRAERIRELEAERDMARQEYHELEEFHRLYIDPYKGDDGGIEAAKSYLIGRLRELNRGYKQREARLDKIRAEVLDPVPLGAPAARAIDKKMTRILAILDGETE